MQILYLEILGNYNTVTILNSNIFAMRFHLDEKYAKILRLQDVKKYCSMWPPSVPVSSIAGGWVRRAHEHPVTYLHQSASAEWQPNKRLRYTQHNRAIRGARSWHRENAFLFRPVNIHNTTQLLLRYYLAARKHTLYNRLLSTSYEILDNFYNISIRKLIWLVSAHS